MRGVPSPSDLLVSLRPDGTTLSPSRSEVVGFDLEGRPISWMVDGRTFKRSLASEVVGRRTVDGVRRRWPVPADEARGHFARAAEIARDALAALRAGRARTSAGPGGGGPRALDPAEGRALAARLADAMAWTPERLADEATRFAGAYRPVTILPPDQYEAVVVQATYGCSWNRCTFCTFYQGRPFEVRAPSAFAEHVAAVAALLGRAARARRSVFFADGNALVLSNRRLEPLVREAVRVFPERPLHGFVDVFGGERKRLDDWRQIRSWGFERVVVGLETGSDALLAYLDKPGGADDATAFVSTLKEAGLGVSVVVMVGIGGRRFAREHEEATLRLFERLPLGAGDLVYLSPFVLQPGSRYAERARRDGTEPLPREEREAQFARLRDGARGALPGARAVRYPIDEFVY